MKLSDFRHVHCIGIGGIGLSAIAFILLDRGYTVSGSDMKESTITDQLKEKGASIYIGHRAENIEGAQLLVYSAAVSADNPEIIAAKENGIPCVSRAEALGVLMDEYELSVAVSGTHGKTTTTSMASLMLKNADFSPTVLVGGVLSEFGGENVNIGKSEYFVTEACEYMDSFLELKPYMEIILNIDSDHLDYFKDINHIEKSFETFAGSVKDGGTIIAYDANPFVRTVIDKVDRNKVNVVTFGLGSGSDFYADNISFDEQGYPSYDLMVRRDGRACKESRIQLAVTGEHNVINSLAAIAACASLGVSYESMEKTLAEFKGTHRRFDVVGTTKNGVKIIDDYAHHPTEIKATLAAAQNVPHKKIWCLFQPHTYTRTLALFDQFADAFGDADRVVFAEIYAAREKNIYKLSSNQLADKVKELHPDKQPVFISDFREIADFVQKNTESGDLVITMGAGDIYKVGELMLK